MKSVQVGIEELVGFVAASRKETTIASINKIVKMYEGKEGERQVWSAVKRSQDLSKWISEEELNFEDSSEDENSLPNWFRKAHINCELPKYLLNFYENHLVIFSPQVEWCEGDNSHELSLYVISVTAGILFGEEASTFDVLTHLQGHVGIKTLYTFTRLSSFGELPTLFSGTEFMKLLSYEKKLWILNETLLGDDGDSRDFVQRWPASYRMWIACLLHYVIRKDGCFSSFKKHEILAVVVSIFLCVVKNLFVNPSQPQKSKAQGANPLTLFQQAVKTIQRSWQRFVRTFYRNFEDFGEVTGKRFVQEYDKKIPYVLAEYQCLVFHSEMLNSLLDKPFKSPRVRYTINNFFMYNFAKALMTTAMRPWDRVGEFPDIFTSLFCKVEEMVPLISDFVGICLKLLHM